jgi:hypothetical protein
MSARAAPIAGPNLNPCPEQAEATITCGASGSGPTANLRSSVIV